MKRVMKGNFLLHGLSSVFRATRAYVPSLEMIFAKMWGSLRNRNCCFFFIPHLAISFKSVPRIPLAEVHILLQRSFTPRPANPLRNMILSLVNTRNTSSVSYFSLSTLSIANFTAVSTTNLLFCGLYIFYQLRIKCSPH